MYFLSRFEKKELRKAYLKKVNLFLKKIKNMYIRGWDSINGDNFKGDCAVGREEGRRNRRTGNYETSANSSSHGESSWRLKELTEWLLTRWVGSMFQYFTTRFEKDDFVRRRRLGHCSTLKEWPIKPGCSGGINTRLGLGSYPQKNCAGFSKNLIFAEILCMSKFPHHTNTVRLLTPVICKPTHLFSTHS